MSDLIQPLTQVPTLAGTERFACGVDGELRRPRLLFVGAYPPFTMATRAVSADLARRLGSLGWTATLTSSQPTRLTRVIDVHVTIWRSRRAYDLAHIDVFSGAAFRWAEGATAILRSLGKPYVLTLHGGNLPAFTRTHRRRVDRLLRGAARVIAPSRYLVDELCAARRDAVVFPNPIEVERYRASVRQQARPRIVWLRAFHAIYDPKMAVRVAAELATDFPSLDLGMIGPDKDGSEAQVRAEARALGVQHMVRFGGPIPKSAVPEALSAADIFLNTTTVDNTPVSVLEAMACGLCVVSTNVGGIPYLLTHEHDALLVPRGDAPAMAAAVRRILTEPGLAERLSCNARATAERHDWSHVLLKWEALFLDVAAEASKRHG